MASSITHRIFRLKQVYVNILKTMGTVFHTPFSRFWCIGTPSAFSLTAGDGSSGNKPFQLFVFCHAYVDRHELQNEHNMRHLILCLSMVGRLAIGSAGVVYKKSFLQQTWYGVMEQMRLDTWLDNGWLVLTILGLPWAQMRKKVPCNQKDRVGLVFFRVYGNFIIYCIC